ncbi:CoA-binding protein [Niabella insulamsoli]|uniref:CoA-binding protein n=1 Tax=Niabella insulamsoli TaxID=3144874 RepID=UPI0031FCAA61
MNKKTLVLGASENPSRYGHMAVKRLRARGHDVIAIGRREGIVEDVAIHKGTPNVEEIDTVTMYMNDQNQKEYESYILSLNPKRIIFNPGAENRQLAQKASEQGVEVINACTLVMLSTGQY